MCINSYIGNPSKMTSTRQSFKSRIMIVHAGGALAAIAAGAMVWLWIWLWLSMDSSMVRAMVMARARVNFHSA